MNNTMLKVAGIVAVLALSGATTTCFAGTSQKWEEVPEAVRATILAKGGVAGQSVDKENGTKDGQAVYEASVKDKDGNASDLVVTEDGKLVEVKTDDAADKAAEQGAKKILDGVKFSHPRDIANPYLPLASLKQDILDGKEGGRKVRVARTVMTDKHKTFKVGGQDVEALVMEDRAIEGGELAEVATDYFAQDDNGTVYYLGEEVDEYQNGKVVGHAGSWMLGKDTEVPGILLPARPKVGDKFKSEDVSKDINEEDEVLSVSETVTVPAGIYKNCVKVREHLADGTIEYKYYALGVGVVREVPSDGDLSLKSHTTNSAK